MNPDVTSTASKYNTAGISSTAALMQRRGSFMPAQPLRSASYLLKLTNLSEIHTVLCLFVCEVLADRPRKNKGSTCQLKTQTGNMQILFANTISSREFCHLRHWELINLATNLFSGTENGAQTLRFWFFYPLIFPLVPN